MKKVESIFLDAHFKVWGALIFGGQIPLRYLSKPYWLTRRYLLGYYTSVTSHQKHYTPFQIPGSQVSEKMILYPSIILFSVQTSLIPPTIYLI